MGLAVAAFFVTILPGNISQYVTQTDAFGLNTDRDRLIRLFFQPLLVLWALWVRRCLEGPAGCLEERVVAAQPGGFR